MLKGLTRNNRGLSPIFATLIILAVVTVLFIPVFIWAQSMASASEDFWRDSALVATERIVIEEVSLSSPIVIYVRNIGKTEVSINNVLIEKQNSINPFQTTIYAYQINEITTKDPLDPLLENDKNSITQGDLLAIKITNLKTLSLDKGPLYTIRVFTTRGVGGEFQIAL